MFIKNVETDLSELNADELKHLEELMAQFKATPTRALFQEFVDFSRLGKLEFAQLQLQQMGRGMTPELIGNASALMTEYYGMKINVPVVGASGAIYGLLLGFGMLFPNVELMLIFLPIPIKAKYFIPVLMAIELYLGLNQFSWDNIAHFAHLGGAVTGFFLILYWRKFGSPWGS